MTEAVNVVQAAESDEEREALGFRQWPTSGEQTYRVGYQADGAIRYVDVQAAGGDDAVSAARAEIGNAKITTVHAVTVRRKLGVKAA